MVLFLTVFFLLYGAMNAYFYWRVRAAMGGLGRWGLLLAAMLALMVVAPLLYHWLERRQQLGAARAVGFVAFTWLAVLFWFCAMGWAVDLWNLAVRLAAQAVPGVRAALAGPKPTFAVLAGLVAIGCLWGWFEAGRITVKEVAAPSAHLPAGRDSLRLAQISDVHLGGPRCGEYLAKLADLLRQLRPDAIVSTGDLVDADVGGLDDARAVLGALKPPLGKFAVLGNHEFYAGVARSIEFHEAAGFRVLRGEHVDIAPGVRIAGVDDPAGRFLGGEDRTDVAAALPPGLAPAATVLLKHQPRVGLLPAQPFDLQLSGHTHGGQIFPFYFITRLVYRLGPGLHAMPGRGSVYVSRGTGTWGPPLRLAAPPEVTLITLKRAR
jgi:hypothetical protein